MGRSDPESPVIREASDSDVDAFSRFFVGAWQQSGPDALGFAGATDEVIEELTTREAVLERIGGPVRRMFLAWIDERVVGFAATKRVDADTAELAGIIILPTHTGRGIGTALVAEVVKAMKRQGYQSLIVRTESDNDPARGFYESQGFGFMGTALEHIEDVSLEVSEFSLHL